MHRLKPFAALPLAIALFAMLAAAPSSATAEQLDIEFLPVDAGANLIIDESHHPYFELLNPLQMQAKISEPLPDAPLQEQQNFVRAHYRDAVRAFSDEEKEAIRAALDRVDELVGERWPGIIRRPWRFVGINNSVEGALPHTRADAIVLPQRFVDMIVAAHNQDQPSRETFLVAAVLVHEQIHVLQRLNPELFHQYYREGWNFIRAETIHAPEWLDERDVVNPDGVDVRWVLAIDDNGDGRRYVWPKLVFNRLAVTPTMPDDFHWLSVAVEPRDKGDDADAFEVVTDENGNENSRLLTQDAGYLDALPLSHRNRSNYHPHEIMAGAVEELVMTWQYEQLPEHTPAQRRFIDESLERLEDEIDWLGETFGP